MDNTAKKSHCFFYDQFLPGSLKYNLTNLLLYSGYRFGCLITVILKQSSISYIIKV